MRLSDYLINFLHSKGVDCIFLLSGGGMMHLLDAVRLSPIRYVAHHHEQAAAIAAEGYARAKNNLGVCFATSGPGATNLVTGIAGAWTDSSPVLFITGQSKLSQTLHHTHLHKMRQVGTFEIDIVSIAKPITKYAVFLDDPNQIKYHLEKAVHLACSDQPGPVLIDIPIDLQGAIINPDELKGYFPQKEQRLLPNKDTIEAIVKKITTSQRPLICAGHGVRVSQTHELFHEWINKYSIPVVTTPLANDLLPFDHPLYIGHMGLKGDRAGNFAIQTADLIIFLGNSMHPMSIGYDTSIFAPKAYKIHVDLNTDCLKKAEHITQLQVNLDIQTFLEAFLKYNDFKPAPSLFLAWTKKLNELKNIYSIINENHSVQKDIVNFYRFINYLSDILPQNTTLVTDAGSAFYIVGQAFKTKLNQRVIVSGGLGSMGFALPAATGAAMANPNRLVICVTGDGSLQTNIHELAVIKQNNLNIKVFVINNQGYSSIKNTQHAFFKGGLAGVDQSTGVFIPETKALAAAYQLSFSLLKDESLFQTTLAELINQPGPSICEVLTHQKQPLIPSVLSTKNADGSMRSDSLHEMSPKLETSKLIEIIHDLESM